MRRLALFALLLSGCEHDGTPQLIRVSELMPREAEIGDALQIRGDGFPQGRAAHVRFRGTLHRPGETPVQTEIEANGTATSTTEVSVAFDEDLESRFCGVGKRATHTTFAGEVEVAFSPALEGAPPVAGSTLGASLDVRPPVRASSGASEDGLRTLAVLGIRVETGAKADQGIAVASIDEGSRASAAGIVAGDVLATWGGVRIGSMSDVALAPGTPFVRVGLRRGGSPTVQSHDIETTGVSANGSVDAWAAVLILALALGAILGFAAPRPAWLVRLESRMARTRLVPTAGEAIAFSAAALVPWAICALGRADLDVVLALLASCAAFVATAIVAGGARSAGRAITSIVPLAIASAIAMFQAGALRIDDAVRAQGAWPWEWQAARDPSSFVAMLLACGALAMDAGGSVPVRLAQRAMIGFSAGLCSALVFGGWAPWGGSPHVAFVGAIVHLAKAWIAIATVLAVRAHPPRPADVWKRVVPACFGLAALSYATAELVPAPYLLATGAALLPILAGIVVRARPSDSSAAWVPSALR